MFQIPENKLPDCLRDENRLNVLFGPLRSHGVNPKDWQDKISTWKIIIKVFCEINNIYTFTVASLNEIFVRHGRPPQCLNEVINDMLKNREILDQTVYSKDLPVTWPGWITDNLIKKPINWSLTTINSAVRIVSKPVSGPFVHLEVVATKSEELLNKIPDNCKSKLLSVRELYVVLDNNKDNNMPDFANLKLLLRHLNDEKRIRMELLPRSSVNDEMDTILVKFVDGQNTSASISSVEIGIHTLEQNERLISKHVENLENEIDKSIEEAKQHLKKKHKHLAKSCLIKKHQLEKQLEQKANALHNVQNCLEQLKSTHTNSHVWDAYKTAVDTFTATYKETGITEESVDDTMIKLGEALDINDEIQAALAKAPNTTELFDTSDLEKELDELLEDEDENPPPNNTSGTSEDLEKDLEKLKINFPEIPDNSPDASAAAAF